MTATPSRLEAVAHLSRDGKPWRVYLENTTTRHAFYEATGTGRGTVTVRHGRIGTNGRRLSYDYGTAWTKLHEKIAGAYEYADGTSDAVPVQAQPRRQRARTLRDRVAAADLQPTTTERLMTRAADEGLSRMVLDADYTDAVPGADAVSVLQSQSGRLVVVARYGDELMWADVRAY
jgi:predicted DNA-binding WGR domain protein